MNDKADCRTAPATPGLLNIGTRQITASRQITAVMRQKILENMMK